MGYLTPTNSFSKYKGYIPYQSKSCKIRKAGVNPTYTLPKLSIVIYNHEKHLLYKTRERLFNSTVDRRVGIISYILESKYYTCSNCKEFDYG
jgi:hypothetical protein